MEKERILELFLELLARAKKSVPLYPPESHAVREWIQRFHRGIPQLLANGLRFPIRFEAHHVRSGETTLLTIDPILDGLRFDLLARGIEEVTIDEAVEEREVMAFLTLLTTDPFVIQEAGGPQAVLSHQGITHITVRQIALTARADRPEKMDSRLLSAEEQVQLLVDRALRALVAHLRTLALDRMGLARWLVDIGEGDRSDLVYDTIRTVAGLVASEREATLFLRTIAEAIWALPKSLLLPLVRDWVFPRVTLDVEALNVISHFSEDELQRLRDMLPEEALLSVVATLEELPGEDVRRQRVMESIRNLIREATVESLPSAPPQMEEGAVARLREMIVASFQSDGLLGLGVRVLMALLFHGDNDEYPASAVEALEESVGIALSRGRLDVALEILNGVRSGSLRGEWFREHNQRSAALFRRAADQTHIGLAVGLLKDHRTSERAELIGEYLRLVGEHGLREFVTQLAEERSRPVRAFMCHILVRVGRPAVPSLRLLTEDRRWYVARNAVTVLGRIGDRSALPSIHEAARYPDPRVRKEAARVLGAWADGETLTPLLALLGDPDRDVTVTVIKVLGRLGLEEGIRPLENLALARAGRPVESAIREEAIRALAAMKTRPAREAIREIAHRRLWLWQRQERQIRSLAVRAARGERIA